MRALPLFPIVTHHHHHLDTLPMAAPLTISDAAFASGMRHRLGLSQMPPGAPMVACDCADYYAYYHYYYFFYFKYHYHIIVIIVIIILLDFKKQYVH
jgi:hypothetical protein